MFNVSIDNFVPIAVASVSEVAGLRFAAAVPYAFVDGGAQGECKSASFLTNPKQWNPKESPPYSIRILDFVGRLARWLPGNFDSAHKGNGQR